MSHIDKWKGLKWEVVSGGKEYPKDPIVYKTDRKDDDGAKIISFATVTTRLGGHVKTFRAEVTILGSNGKVATTLDRVFDGRGGQFTARKWAEIMLFYPPARVITHVEL